MEPTLLLVDDDTSNLASLVKIFDKMQIRTLAATSGEEGISFVRETPVDIILTDLMMPGMDGIDLLKNVKDIAPDTEVIMMTAYATIERAVEAMKEGAYDFVTKPFRRAQIERVVKRAIEKQRLLAENRALKAQLETVRQGKMGSGIIGNSAPLRRVLDIARQASPSTATVLLMGESGTGKELFARFIHEHSHRSNEPFVAVNCGALPDSIIESELFGAEKGAFTGAHSRREGLFARAHRGTLFLDEVSELSLHVQVKLLRVIQSGEYQRVGGSETLQSNCRIVAASNKSLEEQVQTGQFREDLFYRLNVIPIQLPALRDRVGLGVVPRDPDPTGDGLRDDRAARLHRCDGARTRRRDRHFGGCVRRPTLVRVCRRRAHRTVGVVAPDRTGRSGRVRFYRRSAPDHGNPAVRRVDPVEPVDVGPCSRHRAVHRDRATVDVLVGGTSRRACPCCGRRLGRATDDVPCGLSLVR